MKRFYLVLLIAGIALRIYFAFQYQSRVWIDEVWVVLNPAYRLLTGSGWLNPGDWQIEIRSWLPPGLLFILLKTLAVLGLTKGPIVLLIVRIFGAGFTCLGLLAFLSMLRREFRLKFPPILGVATLLFVPEFIRFSTSADLSVMALPFLLIGLWCFLPLQDISHKPTLRLGVGAFLLSLAVAIRLQYATVPLVLFLFLGGRRRWIPAAIMVVAAALVLAFDVSLNSHLYGHMSIPLWNYFRVNSIEGLASNYGTTPFVFAFEILWRFITEPCFILAVLLLPFAFRKSPVLATMGLALFVSHAVIPHKEFRFFYGPGVFLVGLGAVAFQRWLEDQPPKKALATGAGFLLLFAAVALWRGATKVAWAEYEVPSRLETFAGVQPDVKGLITYGWGGIRSGGAYTFHRTLPYEFAENLKQLQQRHLAATDYNYVITGASEKSPCSTRIEELHGGVLYRCSEAEIKRLISANTGL